MEEANEIIEDLLNEQSALLWEVRASNSCTKVISLFCFTVENPHARVAHSIA